ncbi:MAG TPA: PD-(D/E)XK nuclease family protein, partial [Dokdonella sp.]|nr:PD-(D/E)XK nuclease family protein [Dokdonella sp.]
NASCCAPRTTRCFTTEDAMQNIVTIRASALSDFLDCPARAEAKHLLGKRCSQSGGALLGKAIHKSTAVFDVSTMTNQGITADEAAAAAVDAIQKPDEDVHLGEDESKADIENIAVALHHRYCAEIAPTRNYVGVEVTCERLEITDIGLALTGTTDRIESFGPDGNGIGDIKSGKTAVRADGRVETKGHRYQIGVYELLAEKASGISITAPGRIIGLQVAKTERGQRVAVSEPIHGARDVLVGDAESPGILETVARAVHAGIFPGNPRSMLCHEKYCPIFSTCKYRK